ncbi:rhodanese-like domain-containing protein [Thermus filiformis]|uniref:Sulfurtransferase n=1 Tax=Thermus filiformis TaxID=276 RepID=A0A0A2WRP8_THEFI|nr:rhodanese-like domain-containing protein [Thermus filiformis]KGQ22841.2 sulfurtransferase [Thermus filiformis]
MKSVRKEELEALLARGALVVDVRPKDKRTSPLPFVAVWIPVEAIQKGSYELPKDRPLLLVCEKGLVSQVAGLYLESDGYPEVYSLEGGLRALTEG